MRIVDSHLTTAPGLARGRTLRLALCGAAMLAAAPAAHAATFFWSGGLYVPGTTSPDPLLAPDTLAIVTGSNKLFDAVSFINQSGIVDWQGGSIFLSNAATVINQSLWTASGNDSLVNNGGATSLFTNSGIFRKAGGIGTTNIANAFLNTGTIDAQTGQIVFSGGGATFAAGSVFTGAGDVVIQENVAFNGGFTSSNLAFGNGTYTGTAAALTGTADWRAGTFNGGWNVTNGSTLTAVTGSNKLMDAASFTNDGTIAWQGGTLFLSNGIQLTNNGVFGYATSSGLINNGGAVSTVTNAASGTFQVDAGSTVTINNRFVNDGGTLDADGTFAFNGSNATFNAGSVFSGAGIVAINSSAAFNGGFTSANVDFNGGIFTGNGAVLNGTADWAAGTFSGGWNVASGSTLTALTGSNKLMDAATFTNDGTIAWQGGTLFLSNATQLVNNGLLGYASSSGLINNGGVVSTVTNTGSGTVRVDGGATVNVNNRFVNDGGTLDVDGTLAFNGSNAVFNAGSVFSGTGIVAINSSAAFNGGFTSSNVDFNAGTFTGAAAVLNGTADWRSGTFSGGWNVAAGSTLTALTGSNKLIDAATVTNDGTIVWQGGSIFLSNGTQIVNAGTIDVQGNDGIINNGGAASSFVNEGLIQKTAGGGTTTIGNSIGFDNEGTLDVRSGTIALPGNFANDGTLTGTGTFAVAGTLTNNGIVAPGVGAGQLSLSGNYLQTSLGTLAIQLASSSLADLFSVSGTGQLGGTLALSCIASCGIANGDIFTIFDSAGALSGTFANITTSGFLSGFDYSLNYDYDLDRVQLTVLDAGMVSGAVPEPATWAMMIGGLGLVGGGLRRRTARARRTASQLRIG